MESVLLGIAVVATLVGMVVLVGAARPRGRGARAAGGQSAT
jgi:hypothetical protein